MKGLITILEMIAVIIILIVAFSVFFPAFSYKNKWSDALLILKGRDVVLTIDRLGFLYRYSFNPSDLKYYLDKMIPANETGLIHWSETEGTMKNRIVVACNCSEEERVALASWASRLKLNGRGITITTVQTGLENIQASDVLLIWGYRDLTPYIDNLREYLSEGNGIVEIADFVSTPEPAQASLFGLAVGGDWGTYADDRILKPEGADNIKYQAYKLFYHLPLPVSAFQSETSVQVDPGFVQPACTVIKSGFFKFRNIQHKFWICDSAVYFDADANGLADSGPFYERQEFAVNSYEFYLNYVEGDGIHVSFMPDYMFADFASAPGTKAVWTADDSYDRVLLLKGDIAGGSIDAVDVLNATGRTVWIADFSRGSLGQVGDDHKALLLSQLMSSSNKRTVSVLSSFKLGYMTSYLNVDNTDLYEVYRFNLGLGYPYY